MRIPPQLPAGLGTIPFTVTEAIDAGASVGRLRYRGFSIPSRGIRVPASATEDNNHSSIRPYTIVTAFSAASHATAFVLWQFPGYLPGVGRQTIHISRPDTMAIVRRRGVTGYVGQFFDDEIVSCEGLLVTSRVRTWLDCARRMSVDEITVVADHLLREPRPALEGRDAPFATMEDLEEMLDRHKGTPGIRKARLALKQARVGADSAPETRLRLALEYAGVPEPELNVPTVLGAGVVRQPDLSYPEQKVAVEYDGEVHSDTARIIRDITREEDYTRAGWLMVRISKLHMENEAKAAVRKVSRALRSRGWMQSDSQLTS
ncbi:hypothetical protein FDW83_14165 [Pseudarthrobacter sp. NamE2]|uniref:hypothetical protein n=1 Tax=Pseudarthrobacter sp. NamE2 TaxID=2576838 RepID=UPI0010FDA701|nr:hypothetical protein [Pseudarthrobacter sp. NamE2]TLM81881.1 hypothetical protein FDW83_14165 [Pseudarthrobacter sp. NamE2]